MSKGLREDPRGEKIQGFAPFKIITITADAEWTPEEADTAFRVGVACSYYNSNTGSGHEAGLVAGSITAIPNGMTYTFDTTQQLEVM